MAFTSAKEFQDELARRTGKRILLFVTDNRRRMVSIRVRGTDFVEVRVQRIFLESPPEVVDGLVDLLSGGTRGRTVLRSFIDARFRPPVRPVPPPAASAGHSEHPGHPARSPGISAPPAAPRPIPVGEPGAHHDIVGMARRLNEAYLGDRSRAGVVWGKRSRSRNRSSIRFACYDPSRNLVIMNRKLDTAEVPAYFVEFVLFHELLHEVLGIESRPDGRRSIHGKLFRLMESTYPDYDKALRFEKEFCRRLGFQ